MALGIFLDPSSTAVTRLSRTGYSIRHALLRDPDLRAFDVLALQELCSDHDGAQIKRVSFGHGVHLIFGREDLDRDGECKKGQAILSRHPILDSGLIELPKIRSVGRSTLWADIQLPGQGPDDALRVYNVHLDNRGESFFAADGRWTQAQAVLAHYASWHQEHPGAPVVITGDFNSLGNLFDPWREERTITELRGRLKSALPGDESTHILSYALDWIFYDGLTLVDSKVVSLLLSDHYPVVAHFRLPGR